MLTDMLKIMQKQKYVRMLCLRQFHTLVTGTKVFNEGRSAVDDYMKFLHSGCTKDPVSLLQIAGVDLNTPAPVEAALKVFEEVLDKMESLI